MWHKIRNHPFFIIIIAFELIWLCSLISSLFHPIGEFFLKAEDFEESLEETSSVSQEFSLPAGAFEVIITYTLQSSEKAETDNISSYTVGNLSILSNQCPAGIHAGTINLDSSESRKNETIWINYGTDIDDIKVCVQYIENEKFIIDGIDIRECYIYRFIRLFGFAFLFIIIDFLYITFFTDWIIILREKRKSLAILLGILVIVSIPLLENVVYYGHDLDFHMNRIASLALGLAEGQFPVRIHSDMLNGYGYATSLFYGDTLLYIPAVLFLMKVPLGMCYQIYILINHILTIIFSYLCFKAIVKEDKYTLIGIFIYTLAPYRLINIYTRAAVGEFTAMTFFPLVILGFWNIFSKEKWNIRDYCSLIIGLSGIFQSHVISTVMVVVFIVLFCVAEWRKTFQIKRLLCLIKSATITFLVNLWFLVPMLDSMSMDIKSTSRTGVIQEQGLYPIQWVNLFFSAVGKSLNNTTQEEMGFSLGIPICIGVGLALFIYAKRKDILNHENIRITIVCLGLGLIAVCLTSRFFPWDILADRSNIFAKYFCMIQYPWRYLAIATILLSVSTIGAIAVMGNWLKMITMNVLIGSMIVSTVISVGYYFQQFTYQSPAYCILSDNDRNLFYIGNEEYLLTGSSVEEMRTRKIIASQGVDVEEQERVDGRYVFLCNNRQNRKYHSSSFKL